MLGKLFKHEFSDLFRKTIIFFSVVIGLSLLVFLFGELGEKYWFFTLLNSIFIVGYVFSIMGILLYSVFYPVARFYKSMLKDEGYLTHTLPVTTGQLLFTKLTTAFVLFISSFVVAVGSLVLTNTIGLEIFKDIIHSIHRNHFIAYMYVVFYLIAYYYGMLMLFITALVLGHSRPTKKGLNSIFAGLIIYGIQQVLGTISVFILFLTIDINNPESFQPMHVLLSSMIIYVVVVISEVIVSYNFLKKKLNLE